MFFWTDWSEVKNQIAGHGELIVVATVVVGFAIPGSLEAKFRPQLNG